MKCEAIHELLTQYLLGDLPPNVSEELRAHLQDCDGCRAEAAEIESTLDLLRDALAATSSVPASMEKSHYEKIYSAGAFAGDDKGAGNNVIKYIGTWFTTTHHQLAAAVAMICIGGILLGVSMVQFGGRAVRREGARSMNILSSMKSEGGPLSAAEWADASFDPNSEPEEEILEIEEIEEASDDFGGERYVVAYGGRSARVSGKAFATAGGSADISKPESGVDPFAAPSGDDPFAALEDRNVTVADPFAGGGLGVDDPFGAADTPVVESVAVAEPDEPETTVKYGFAAKPPSGNIVSRLFKSRKLALKEDNAALEVSDQMVTVANGLDGAAVNESPAFFDSSSIVAGDVVQTTYDAKGKLGKGGGGGGWTQGVESKDELSKVQVQPVKKQKRIAESGRKAESRTRAYKSFGGSASMDLKTLDNDSSYVRGDLPAATSSEAPEPSPSTDFSPQPAEFDAVAMVKSPVIMKGIYGSRSPGARGAALAAYGGAVADISVDMQSASDVGLEVVMVDELIDSDADGMVDDYEQPLASKGFSGGVSVSAGIPVQAQDVRQKADKRSQSQSLNREIGEEVQKTLGDKVIAGYAYSVDSGRALESLTLNERGLEKERKYMLGTESRIEAEGNVAEINGREGKDADKEVYYRYLPTFEAVAEKSNKPAQPKPVARPAEIAKKEEDLTGPKFRAFGVNPFVNTLKNAFSTFAIDVDTASYTLGRNYMLKGLLPPAESVRTEEFVNFFDYDYAAPSKGTFKIYTECAPSKFGHGMNMLKIGVKGRAIGREEKQNAILTFVIDSSGSMNQLDRMGLLKKSIAMLLDELTPEDEIAIVQFGSKARLVLEHTSASQKQKIIDAVNSLQTSGSTNLEEAMLLAYRVAAKEFKPGASNRVLIMSDGAANIGEGAAQDILGKVKKYSKQGIFCSVFGFGIGTYNDEMLETLANKGNGTYNFIDSENEAKRIFVDELSATLNTIASDVKIQVEFMPNFVKQYRQLGYENRQLTKKQFRDNTVDAGEVGSGQSVTALYELDLASRPELYADLMQCMAVVRVRYRRIDTGAVEEIEKIVSMQDIAPSFNDASAKFRLACGVAEFAEILRGSIYASGSEFNAVAEVLRPIALEFNLDKRIRELTDMVQNAGGMSRGE